MAGSINLDLGRLDLVSTTSGLVLQLTGFAQFAASQMDDLVPKETLTRALRDFDGSRNLWISKADNFRLAIGLRIDQNFGLTQRQAIIETFAEQIRIAELWPQLCLSPVSVEMLTIDDHAVATIITSLTYDDSNVKKPTRKLHKLNSDVPFYDVKPPNGVNTCALEAVHLLMSVSKPTQRKRRKPAEALWTNNERSVKKIDSAEPVVDDLDSEVELTEFTLPALTPSEPTVAVEDHDLLDDVLLSAGIHGNETDADSMLLAPEEAHLGCSPPLSQKLAPLKRRSSTLKSQLDRDSTYLRDETLQMLDAGMRLAISDSPKWLPRGTRIATDQSFRRLADLAPALWWPNYHPNISARAAFIPTISNVLVNFCEKRASAANFRCGFDEYSRRPIDTLDNDPSETNTKIATTARLWRLLQRSCFDRYAARSLKPLTAKCSDREASKLELFESLDASQASNFLEADDVEAELDIPGSYSELEIDAEHHLFDFAYFDNKSDNFISEKLEDLTNEASAQTHHQQRLSLDQNQAELGMETFTNILANEGAAVHQGSPNEDLLSVCASVGSLSLMDDELGSMDDGLDCGARDQAPFRKLECEADVGCSHLTSVVNARGRLAI